jgi:hypothetical protein
MPIGSTAFTAHDFTIVGQSTFLPESVNSAFRLAGCESFHWPAFRETDFASTIEDFVTFKICLGHFPSCAVRIRKPDLVEGFIHF